MEYLMYFIDCIIFVLIYFLISGCFIFYFLFFLLSVTSNSELYRKNYWFSVKILLTISSCVPIIFLFTHLYLPTFVGVPPACHWYVVLWESRVWRLFIPWSATVNRQIHRFLCFPHCHRSYRRCDMRGQARHGWANRLCRKEVLLQAVQCGKTDWWRICEILVFVGKLCVRALE